jgi:hypothetical protein
LGNNPKIIPQCDATRFFILVVGLVDYVVFVSVDHVMVVVFVGVLAVVG